MPAYLHPGVYIEEIPSGSKPIEGVATSVAAFVGAANRGPVGEPVLIGKFDDYLEKFGPITGKNDAMGLAVQAYYLNGGGGAYICRLAGEFDRSKNETPIKGEGGYDGTTNSRIATGVPVLSITASSPGTWGNALRYKIEKPHRDARLFSLAIGRLVDGKFVEDERFDNLSMDAGSDDYIVTKINGISRLATVNIIAPDGLYQQAKIFGADVSLAKIQTYLGDATKSTAFTIRINGSQLKSALLTGLNGSSNEAEIATAMQTAIRTALAIDTVVVSQTFAGGAGKFTIETTGTASSSTRIQLIDSDLLTTFGLSSKNVASVTGSPVGPSPNVAAGSGFRMTLDQYETLEVIFESGLTGGKNIADEIQRQVNKAFPAIASFSGFKCIFDTDHFTFSSGGSDVLESSIVFAANSAAASDARTSLGLNSPAAEISGRVISQGIDPVVPSAMPGTNPAPGFGERLIGGVDTDPVAADFTDFYGTTLRKYRDISIIVLPGSTWDGGTGQANIEATRAHCEKMKNRMVIVDPPATKEFKNATVLDGLALPTSTYTVLYYPWVYMANPLYHPDKNPNVAKTVLVAPSAIAAGMWAKIDGKRGVWKAPAGVETQLTGAARLEYIVEDLEQDQLNPLGVNCIRKLPSYGSVFWGSRTLATKADPEWRYVPVRRTAIYIEESIYQGIQWAVFEPNDAPLWSSLRANIGSFMNGLFRAGAFQGQTTKEAYFVRCGLGDTMTQGDIDRGQVIVIVGFAPLKPAEFVIVRIQQKVGEQ